MRVSQQQLSGLFQQQLQQRQQEIAESQAAIASGQKLLQPSSDPTGIANREYTTAAIDQLTQYDRNIDFARGRLELTENAIQSSADALLRARELTLTAANATTNSKDYPAIAGELRQLHHLIMADANARDSTGEFLFAGSNAAGTPFEADANGEVSYKGNSETMKIQAARTVTLESHMSGHTVFGQIGSGEEYPDENIFSAIDRFASLLQNATDAGGDPEGWQQQINLSIDQIDLAHRQLVAQQSQLGLKLQELDSYQESNANTREHLQQVISRQSDVDYASAISEMQQQLLALEALQKTALEAMQLSLFRLMG